MKLKLLSTTFLALFMLVGCSQTEEPSAKDDADIVISDNSTSGTSTYLDYTVVRKSTIAPGTQCSEGGVEITSGVDENSDGKLEGTEIQETQIVCHGDSGLNSLITINDEPSGSNCSDGGKVISIGLDTNKNSILDTNEINTTSYICNIQNGTSGTDGTSTVTSCSIVEEPNGEKVLTCSDGTLLSLDGGVVYQTSTVQDITGGKQIIDSWNTSGGQDIDSLKNNHYKLEVLSKEDITFEINSNAWVYFYLMNSIGYIIEKHNGLINGSKMIKNLDIGTYTLVVATYSNYQSENYELKIIGDINILGKLPSDKLNIDGKWETSGGQSSGSYRNDHYDFNVTKDTYLDISISNNVHPYLWLYNQAGILISELNGLTQGQRIGVPTTQGIHRLIIGTYSVGENASYSLEITGNFNNFIEKTSNILSFDDSWVSSGGQDRNALSNPAYEFDVTEDSHVDITINSSADNYMYLIDKLDNVETYKRGDRLTADLSAGTYKIVFGTYYDNEASNFEVNIYGQVENLQKLR